MEHKEEQVGFHKGALMTLQKEQEAFVQMLQVIQQLMQAHVKALKDMGIDIVADAKRAQEAAKKGGVEGRLK